MSVINFFNMLAGNLIEFMFVMCITALTLRFIAFKASRQNKAFFNTLSYSMTRIIEKDDAKGEPIEDLDTWFEEFLQEIESHMPERSVRVKKSSSSQKLGDYTDSKRSLIVALRKELDAIKSPFPPNFTEIAERVLNQDNSWRTILKFLPIDSLNRGLDILPNLFIVFGIFGTFIGITSALPLIATIDLNDLSAATPILNSFVAGVAYSMNTSIAGIVYSVIMTIITALFPLGVTRVEVIKNLERSLEVVWYRIHGDQLSKGEEANLKGLKQIANLLESILEQRSSEDLGRKIG